MVSPAHDLDRGLALNARERITQSLWLDLQRIEEDGNGSIGGHHVAQAGNGRARESPQPRRSPVR